MYFKLFADCLPVKGVVRSVIYDVGRGDFKLIPNELYEILTEHHSKTLDEVKGYYDNQYDETIDEYFDFLIKHEFGFYCSAEELDLFPPIPQEFDMPATISNAIIDTHADSNHDYENILAQLAALQCRFVQFRFYSPITYTFLKSVLEQTLDRNIRGVDVILPFTEEFYHERILEVIGLFPVVKLEFHSFDELMHDKKLLDQEYIIPVLFTKEQVTDQTHCGVVDPMYFQVNKELFLESLQFNSCLNRKISIDVQGNIKNCPSMPKSYGNISDTTLWNALQKQGFKDVWRINKDKINVCRHCEFRYMCTDCRAYVQADQYSKPAKCNYDPFTGKWA